MINFFEDNKVESIFGKLFYYQKEFSFIFLMENKARRRKFLDNYATILINNLQLNINLAEKSLMYVFGYHPNIQWVNSRLVLPVFKNSGVVITSNIELKHADVFDIENLKKLPTYFDPVNGWVCIGNKSIDVNANALEFATDTAVVLHEGKIVSIWLHPFFCEKLPDDQDDII